MAQVESLAQTRNQIRNPKKPQISKLRAESCYVLSSKGSAIRILRSGSKAHHEGHSCN